MEREIGAESEGAREQQKGREGGSASKRECKREQESEGGRERDVVLRKSQGGVEAKLLEPGVDLVVPTDSDAPTDGPPS